MDYLNLSYFEKNQVLQNPSESKGIYIDFDLNNSVAILTIEDWHNNILRKYYKQNFKRNFQNISANKPISN